MISSIDIPELFGDDVIHLHGNLYRVRRNRIRLAKSGLSVEDGKLVYGNPRWFVNKDGELEARGTESSKMEELRSSIQISGLDNPIRLRPIDGEDRHLEVVNGERRFRCIENLCDSDEMCHDSSVGNTAPASDVYEWVDCRIEVMDDKTALGVALKTNETSEVIGDLASLQVVKALREAGYDDQEVLKATGKSLSWLRETDRIMGLDEVCLDHFQKDQITRKAAIQLALVANAEERLSLLEKIVEVARGRKESRLKSLNKIVENADMESEVADAAAHLAALDGEDQKSKDLAAKSGRAKDKAENARKERDKVASKPAKADAKDFKNAKGPKPLAHGMIQSEYVDLIAQIIENEGFDEEGDSLNLDLGLLSAVLGVLEAIMKGEDDSMSVLSCHCALEVSDEDMEDADDMDDSEESSDEDSDEDEDEYGESISDEESEEVVAEDETEFRTVGYMDEDEN